VNCPWCGAEMVMRDEGAWAYMMCSNFDCEAEAPVRRTVEEAHAAAMRRYVEPNRVLSWEDMWFRRPTDDERKAVRWEDD